MPPAHFAPPEGGGHQGGGHQGEGGGHGMATPPAKRRLRDVSEPRPHLLTLTLSLALALALALTLTLTLTPSR